MKYVSATDIGLVREENQDMVKVEEFYLPLSVTEWAENAPDRTPAVLP